MTQTEKAQPTPGPWIIETHDTKYPDLKEYSVVAPHGWQEPNGEYKACSVAQALDCEADARLIAAAPRMLELLRAYSDPAGLIPERAHIVDEQARALLREIHEEGQA